jgi:type I restriction enzyme, S subunit
MDFRFSFENLVFVTEEKADSLLPNNAHPGDVVFTQRGTLGQVGLIPRSSPYPRFVISQSQMKLSVDEAIALPEYVYYYFRSEVTVQRIHNHAFSSGVPHINLEILRNFEIALPPLDVQKRIVSILSAYDDLIENNRRRIEILEEMARNIYREWFVHFRFPGHENVQFVDSPLGPIPQGWEVKRLSNLVTTQYGYTESATDEPVGPKFLRGTDINKTSYIDWESVPYCPISDEKVEKYRLSKGDIVVIRMADPGKVGIVEQDVDAVFASYLIRLRRTSDHLSPYYLFYFLTSDRYQDYVTGASTGTTRKSASAKVITDIDFAVPPTRIQESFDEAIRPFRNLITNLMQRNTVLGRTRDLLLSKFIAP